MSEASPESRSRAFDAMIILIRHGLAARGVDDLDPGLAPQGHKQARLTAEVLRGSNIGRLVVSPLRRTRETAAPIAAALGLEAEVRDEVAEVFDPSMAVDERRTMIGPFMAGLWSEQPEVLQAWRQRVVATLLEFERDSLASGRDMVVVSHYIAISVAIGEATGDDHVVPLPIANCSITRIGVENGLLKLAEAGSTRHLPEELVTGVGQALPGR